MEEAGVRASFGALLCARQAHGFQFGKSDLFFCVGLRVDAPGQQPRPCVSGARGVHEGLGRAAGGLGTSESV